MRDTFTTIVGGRSSSDRREVKAPRGVEILLKKARVDPPFRALFETDALAAAASIGLELSDAEAAVLASTPAETLRTMVAHTFVPRHHVPTFLSRNAAAMLAVVLATTVLQPTRAAGGVEAGYETTAAAEVSPEDMAVDRLGVVQYALEEYRRANGAYPTTDLWYLSDHPLEGFVPRTYLFDNRLRPLRYMGVVKDGVIVGYRLGTVTDSTDCPFDPEEHRFRDNTPVRIIAPENRSRIHLVRSGDGASGDTRLRARCRGSGTSLVWYLDGEEIATTTDSHRVDIGIEPGAHSLLVVDSRGYSDSALFHALLKE
jgi:hypothetical protein